MQQPPELHSSPLLATQNGEYMYTQNTPKFQHPLYECGGGYRGNKWRYGGILYK